MVTIRLFQEVRQTTKTVVQNGLQCDWLKDKSYNVESAKEEIEWLVVDLVSQRLIVY